LQSSAITIYYIVIIFFIRYIHSVGSEVLSSIFRLGPIHGVGTMIFGFHVVVSIKGGYIQLGTKFSNFYQRFEFI